MTIRPATLADVNVVVAMAMRFQQETSYATHLPTLKVSTLHELVTQLVTADAGTIIVAERDGDVIGMLAAAVYTHPMSGECVAHELCWWMEPEARGTRAALALVRAAERWALEHGAAVFQMVAPTDRVGTFYEALHYQAVERLYQRRLA